MVISCYLSRVNELIGERGGSIPVSSLCTFSSSRCFGCFAKRPPVTFRSNFLGVRL